LLSQLGNWLPEQFRRRRGTADVGRQELAAEKGSSPAGAESWCRLFGQFFRFDKWRICRGYAAKRIGWLK
jgi:hypothetical protein